jgi:hypothetical protein
VKPPWHRPKKVSLAGSKACSAANLLRHPLPHPQDVASPVNAVNPGVMAPAVKAVAMVDVVAAEAKAVAKDEPKAVVAIALNVAKVAANAPSAQTAETPKAAPSVVNAVKAAVERAATQKAAPSVVNAVVAMAVANAAEKPATDPKLAPNCAPTTLAAAMHQALRPWMPTAKKPPAQRVARAAVAVAAVANDPRQPVTTRPTKTACNSWLHPRTHQPMGLHTANPRSLAKTVKP